MQLLLLQLLQFLQFLRLQLRTARPEQPVLDELVEQLRLRLRLESQRLELRL